MTIMEMLGQSGVLTLLGMGVVFGFLVVMIICVTLSGKVIHAIGADKDVGQPALRPAVQAAGVSSSVNAAAVTAAITAAVAEYRKNNK